MGSSGRELVPDTICDRRDEQNRSHLSPAILFTCPQDPRSSQPPSSHLGTQAGKTSAEPNAPWGAAELSPVMQARSKALSRSNDRGRPIRCDVFPCFTDARCAFNIHRYKYCNHPNDRDTCTSRYGNTATDTGRSISFSFARSSKITPLSVFSPLRRNGPETRIPPPSECLGKTPRRQHGKGSQL